MHVFNGTIRPRTGTTEHNVDDGGHLTGSKRFAAFTVKPESYQQSSARWPQVRFSTAPAKFRQRSGNTLFPSRHNRAPLTCVQNNAAVRIGPSATMGCKGIIQQHHLPKLVQTIERPWL